MESILVLSHISEAYAPTFPFIRFLKKREKIKLDYIFHPLVGTGIKESVFYQYEAKEKEATIRKKVYEKKASTYWYAWHFLQNVIWVFQKGEKYDICFGLNNLNALSGLFLRVLGITRKVVFYTVDYSTQRFNNQLINASYNLVDKVCVKFCDYTLSVSPRTVEVRAKMGLSNERNLLQPSGVHFNEIAKRLPYAVDDTDIIKLIYVGHITKSKGIHLLIEALQKLKNIVNFRFDIYGEGPFLENLILLVHKYHLCNQVKFMGRREHSEILSKYADYDVGIALYTLDAQFNYYCDPVKVKEYLAAGLVTIVSDVPYIAEFIEKHRLGYKTSNSVEDIDKTLEIALDKKSILEVRKNVEKCDFDFDWDTLFSRNYSYILERD